MSDSKSSPAGLMTDNGGSGPAVYRFGWGKNLVLFVATVGSVGLAGWAPAEGLGLKGADAWIYAVNFAVPVIAILLAHEFGHYVAARLHRVPASLPYFIPFPVPWLSPFGTLGAVIVMPGRIRSSRALLDIGAAGPLAGMAVAIPSMIVGLAQSDVVKRSTTNVWQEGQSLLYWALKWLVVGPMRPDQDVLLHPTAFAAWFGFFLTFLNLVPFGQLDGGHVAYALLGRRHHAVAPWIMRVPLLMVIVNLWLHGVPVLSEALHRGAEEANWRRLSSALSTWFVFWFLLALLRRFSGAEHPPVDDPELSPVRRWIGVVTLLLFVAVFMPAPMVAY